MVSCDYNVGSCKSSLRSLVINDYYIVECFNIFVVCFHFFFYVDLVFLGGSVTHCEL